MDNITKLKALKAENKRLKKAIEESIALMDLAGSMCDKIDNILKGYRKSGESLDEAVARMKSALEGITMIFKINREKGEEMNEKFSDTLSAQIAEHLNWTVEQVHQFSFQALRDIVKDEHLKAILTEQIRSGEYIKGQKWKKT